MKDSDNRFLLTFFFCARGLSGLCYTYRFTIKGVISISLLLFSCYVFYVFYGETKRARANANEPNVTNVTYVPFFFDVAVVVYFAKESSTVSQIFLTSSIIALRARIASHFVNMMQFHHTY